MNKLQDYSGVSEKQTVGRSEECIYTNVSAEVGVRETPHPTHTKLSTWAIELRKFGGYSMNVEKISDMDGDGVIVTGQGDYDLGAVVQALERALGKLTNIAYPMECGDDPAVPMQAVKFTTPNPKTFSLEDALFVNETLVIIQHMSNASEEFKQALAAFSTAAYRESCRLKLLNPDTLFYPLMQSVAERQKMQVPPNDVLERKLKRNIDFLCESISDRDFGTTAVLAGEMLELIHQRFPS